MVGVTWKGARGRPSLPNSGTFQPPPKAEERRPSAPAVSFRDKEAYQDLFKPLPKPEPIPPLNPVKIDTKSWRQLQEEREALVNAEIERTRNEADQMWQRAKAEDDRRLKGIMTERERLEQEQVARERIMQMENEEREQKNRARKEEIRRQEDLLSGRQQRAKTTDPNLDRAIPAGIQVYHYKDPEVEYIVKKTREEELMRRRASQPSNIFYDPQQQQQQHQQQQQQQQQHQQQQVSGVEVNRLPPRHTMVDSSLGNQTTSTGQPEAATAGNVYRSVMEGKEFFKVGMVARSQSSSASSTTSR